MQTPFVAIFAVPRTGSLRISVYSSTSQQLIGSGKLHPFLSDTLASRQTWTEIKEKHEAFTSAMFDYMFNDILSKVAKDTSALFDMEAAIFDWTRLGVFTSSRVSEYAQTTARKSTFPECRTVSMLGIGATRPLHLCTVTSRFTQSFSQSQGID